LKFTLALVYLALYQFKNKEVLYWGSSKLTFRSFTSLNLARAEHLTRNELQFISTSLSSYL